MADRQAKRFVVQEHNRPGETTHYDLMLERQGVLATWSFPIPPWKPHDMEDADAHRTIATSGSRNVFEKRWRFSSIEPDGVRQEENRSELVCTQLPDHRMHYLDFEGDIDDAKGTVLIVEKGLYEPESWGADRIVLRFQGRRLSGRFALSRTGGHDARDTVAETPAVL